ncbi:uncharacterized protein LOC132703685 isoform X2 [Cylas formicarius]|uniref:uncharacterized protein LOC132703685 isoform X2 n=1 Tax=Cylas formicarius TaxID=197179 RepID=UPI0029586AE1|nr:uncharacterized protein LOC132703685 isoform X2 [Cylas formicarius]
MKRKTRALYDAVFAYLSRTFNTFINRTIFTDYEAALVTSLRACYPEATLKGCFFIFVRKWILRDTPGHFSVFRHRYKTNNVIESYHKQLNSRLVRYPRIWDLIENLIEIQNIAILELEQLERQEQVFRIATKNSVFNSRVNEAWNNLENGRFTIGDFLRQAEHFVADFDEYLDVRHEKVLPIPSSEAQPLLIQNEAPPLIFFRPPKVTPVLRLNLREMKPPSLIFFKTRPKPPLHDFSQNPSSLDDPLKPSLHNFPQDPLLRDDPPKPSFYHFPRSPISPDDPPKPSLYHFPQIPISPEDPPKPSLYHFPQNPLLLDDPPKPP